MGHTRRVNHPVCCVDAVLPVRNGLTTLQDTPACEAYGLPRHKRRATVYQPHISVHKGSVGLSRCS